MYNRYIPNGKGSFDRQRMPTPPPRQPTVRPPEPVVPSPPKMPAGTPSGHRSILPAGWDTGDLLVLLILILVLYDGEEDPLSMLLSLAAFCLFQ